MRLLFARANTWISYAVRAVTLSRWSHVAFDAGQGFVIDSDYPHGVAARRPPRWTAVEQVEVVVPDEGAVWDFLKSQMGKPYDLGGVIGMPFNRRWHDEDAWFCSELIEAALWAGGFRRFEEPWRVTPQMSYVASRIPSVYAATARAGLPGAG